MMKKIRQSTGLLMSINILVLGLFLFFWLRSEYRNEKSSLMQEAGLEVAERIMLIGGMNLDSLLLNFRGDMMDSLSIQPETRLFRYFQKSDSLLPELSYWNVDDRHMKDTFVNLSVSDEGFPKGDSIRTTYSIVISDDQGGGVTDSLSVTHILRDDYLEVTENISRQALLNIRPQMFFAALLFALSMLAIYLLQRLFRERQQTLESRNVMISNITHELKTPVATIGVALEAIQDFDFKSNPEKTQAYLRTSRLELARLSGLIDQILQFGKIDQGAAHFEFQPHPIRNLLDEAVDTLRLQAEAKEAVIRVSPIPDDWQINADGLHLKSAFVNLMDNSLKYSGQGVHILLDVIREKHQYVITVRDDGPGIRPEYREKVFERFFRIPQGDTHNVKGSGLGLSYAAEVVRAHGGTISLQSEYGKGTTVTIKLPRTDD